MSTASPSDVAPQSEAWITLAESARLLGGFHPGRVKSMALAGAIRHRTLPGVRTQYLRADVERLAVAVAR